MLISDFDYELPENLIAQEPSAQRDASRMLVVDRETGSIHDRHFTDLVEYLRKDDVLVLNNTKVFPARLFGQTETRANVEIFLVKEIANGVWEVLARPAKRLKPNKLINFSDELSARVIDRTSDGKVIVRFETAGDLNDIIDKLGKTPLPPYIKRAGPDIDADRERYQTVYAKSRGAIAAPTAGLHFGSDTLQKIRETGVSVAEITLHVGYGTFEPVRVNDLSEHSVLPEQYEIDSTTAELLTRANETKHRVVAIGTTTTRALESNFSKFGEFTSGAYTADLTITPGYEFRAVDALLTNFHLPKSSLLVLTSTFGGHELIMKAYRHAVAAKYRFYSYGDCMLIV
ncbi:MAG TPA: tRNA preQ1(34) S-adenosylmethionine ribosyltransferase-isomerase QueA [Pyrinomonadaceae bacterium]|nr:tRNA preQ1(34) S-adenosylmethionine ribosyltransferase-isomerase QueA [Pyrinomonadaceae bacterium]